MRSSVSLDVLRAAAFLAVGALLVGGAYTLPFAVNAQTQADAELDVVNEEASEPQNGAASFGSAYTVTPMVANEKAKPRDIIKKELLVANNTEQRMGLRASVENLDPSLGAQEFVSPGVADLSQSLANWIEITRGVIDLAPGESRKIPYLIHVNLAAKPGSYFARISFTDGSTPVPGSEKGMPDGTSLMLNLEVVDDARERLQLGSFIAEDSVVLGENISFAYQLENVGNRVIEPRGSIRIFNRRGEEVGSVPLNADGMEISPENKQQLAAAWSAAGRFGKYKAFLDLEYGENQLASVQDTVYFWVFPWKEIMATIVGVFVLAVFGTYIIHLRTVARPIQVHSMASAAYAEPEVHHADYRRGIHMPSREARVQAAVREPVPLAPLRPQTVALAPEPVQATRVTGSRIELAPRSPKKHAQTPGNVVQLTSRR